MARVVMHEWFHTKYTKSTQYTKSYKSGSLSLFLKENLVYCVDCVYLV
jgi:hypothetical protein